MARPISPVPQDFSRTVARDFLQTVQRVAPARASLARRTLRRIPPTRWQIEWFLPYWLGESFGLDKKIAREFVLSNVLGLAAIRLYDDLADAEVRADETNSVTELAGALYAAALEVYHPFFSPGSPFWISVDAHMSAWRAATARVNQLHMRDLMSLHTLESDAAQSLAQLGAPLKIPARAICELTGWEHFEALDELLDHAFLAAVLHDHVVDCQADLEAGRWNLFVAAVSLLPQDRASVTANRARVAEAWMTGETPRVFFENIARHVRRAQELNRALEIHGITAYLCTLHRTLRHTHNSLARAYQKELSRATEKLFGELLTLPRASDMSPRARRKTARATKF